MKNPRGRRWSEPQNRLIRWFLPCEFVELIGPQESLFGFDDGADRLAGRWFVIALAQVIEEGASPRQPVGDVVPVVVSHRYQRYRERQDPTAPTPGTMATPDAIASPCGSIDH